MRGRHGDDAIGQAARAGGERARRAWLDALPVWSCALAVLFAALFAAPAGAAPTLAQRRAIEAGVARGVLDADLARALDTAERVRVVAVLARARAAPARLRVDAALARLAGTGFVPSRRYERISAIAGAIDAAGLAALIEDPHVERISLEAVASLQLAEAVPLVDLDLVHALGLTGAGTRVAILDSGVALAHPDLAGAVVAQRCFCDDGMPGPAGCCPNGLAQQSGAGAGQDDNGHGTLVAGVVTSAGVQAPLGGAPDASLVSVKVMSATGSGLLSDILAGLDWVLQSQPDVSVVNMSIGFGMYAGDCDAADANTMAFADALAELREAGTLTVSGSGNQGSGTGMIAPACIADAISVGAVWDANVGSQTVLGCTDATTAADKVACWSNSSTTTDVFAPGAIMKTTHLSGGFAFAAGTSFATPLVAACAADLAAGHPEATIDEIADALSVSSVSVVDATNGLAFPRLDCRMAHAVLGAQIPALPGGALPLLLPLLVMAGTGSLALRRRRRAASR